MSLIIIYPVSRLPKGDIFCETPHHKKVYWLFHIHTPEKSSPYRQQMLPSLWVWIPWVLREEVRGPPAVLWNPSGICGLKKKYPLRGAPILFISSKFWTFSVMMFFFSSEVHGLVILQCYGRVMSALGGHASPLPVPLAFASAFDKTTAGQAGSGGPPFRNIKK